MFGQKIEFANGQQLSEVVSFLRRKAQGNFHAYEAIKEFHAPRDLIGVVASTTASEVAEYVREVGITVRDIQQEAELRTSDKHVHFVLDEIGWALDLLIDHGWYEEAGFDQWGGMIDLDGEPVDQVAGDGEKWHTWHVFNIEDWSGRMADEFEYKQKSTIKIEQTEYQVMAVEYHRMNGGVFYQASIIDKNAEVIWNGQVYEDLTENEGSEYRFGCLNQQQMHRHARTLGQAVSKIAALEGVL